MQIRKATLEELKTRRNYIPYVKEEPEMPIVIEETNDLPAKMYSDIRDRILKLIRKSGLTESELSELLGYSPMAITRINQLIELADMFGVESSYILSGSVSTTIAVPNKEDIYTLRDLRERGIISDDLYIKFLEDKILEVCNG